MKSCHLYRFICTFLFVVAENCLSQSTMAPCVPVCVYPLRNQ
jgi:hypothetical protein